MRRNHIAEREAVSNDHFTDLDVDGRSESGCVPDERVELAALTARIDPGGQIPEEGRVEGAAAELGREHLRVDAREHCPHAGREHLASERVGRATPQREDRGHAGRGELAFAVFADIGEEQVAEDDPLDACLARLGHRRAHAGLVDVVRAGGRDLDDVEREAEPLRLNLEQRPPHGVHRDPVCVGVDAHEQSLDLDGPLGARDVQRVRAVLAAAPAHPRPGCAHGRHLRRTAAGRRRPSAATLIPSDRTGASDGRQSHGVGVRDEPGGDDRARKRIEGAHQRVGVERAERLDGAGVGGRLHGGPERATLRCHLAARGDQATDGEPWRGPPPTRVRSTRGCRATAIRGRPAPRRTARGPRSRRAPRRAVRRRARRRDAHGASCTPATTPRRRRSASRARGWR